ncbi:MAG TPA: hypothetical protein VGE53_01355 [Candidatus Paceibacterota bacterium]
MEDRDKILDKADHYRFTKEADSAYLNRISFLPHPKEDLKRAIIERIEELIATYTSLATYVPDELIDWLNTHQRTNKNRRVYLKVLRDMESLRKEALTKLK